MTSVKHSSGTTRKMYANIGQERAWRRSKASPREGFSAKPGTRPSSSAKPLGQVFANAGSSTYARHKRQGISLAPLPPFQEDEDDHA